jgi:type VII secretion integral membrane protein EccD
MAQVGTALARVVIVTPTGRVDLALPEQLPIVSLLPGILRHTDQDPSLDGMRVGGWTLRRGDGTTLDLARSLAAQNVRDGDVLHLAGRRTEWPEPFYDDVADVIATGSRSRGAAWTPGATRLTGLIIAAAVLLVGIYPIAVSGEPWWLGGTAALATAVLLVTVGTTLSRAMGHSVAGAVIGAAGLPYAFTGGALVLAGTDPTPRLGAPHLLLGSMCLLVAGVIGYLGVADGGRVFIGAVTAALYGALGAAFSLDWVSAPEAAAVVVSLVALLLPAMPLLAVRLGRVPLPALPRGTDDLLRDEAQPRRAEIYRAIARADELLTGLILGSVVVAVACVYTLLFHPSVATLLLAGIVSGSLLLRARLMVTVQQRVPLLAGGFAGLAGTLIVTLSGLPDVAWLSVLLPVLLMIAILVCAAGISYSRRAPSPRLGRWSDGLDVVLQLAVVPVACSVLGLYGFMRALNG